MDQAAVQAELEELDELISTLTRRRALLRRALRGDAQCAVCRRALGVDPRSIYCSAACRQQAYRWRKESAEARRRYGLDA